MHSSWTAVLMAVACLVPAPAAVRAQGADAPVLVVGGAVPTPLSLSAADLAAFPRTTVTVEEAGLGVSYTGVLVRDLLERAGAPVGEGLRGENLSLVVLAHARDGYRVALAIAELDPDFSGRDVIVADRANGQLLLDHQGPLRLVVPGDRRPARRVRMLDRLEVVRIAGK
ncbi:MAG: molybdopterin-dependent oxidoreductase [Vicinamibacterales bacterium]